MPTSRTRKKYIQKDATGNPIRKRDKALLKDIRIKQMMRTQLLNQACESLTSAEVKLAIEAGKGHQLEYVEAILDMNGVPVSGESKVLTISKIDVLRLESILRYKERSEKAMLQASL